MANIRLLKSIFLIFIFSLFIIGSTNSSFSDIEESANNIFSTGSVDFSLTDGDNFSDIVPGFTATKTIQVNKLGTLDFKYKLDHIDRSGDTSFCDALTIVNPTDAFTITEDHDDFDIDFSFTDSEAGLQNKSCDLNFVFRAWQLDSNGTWGLTDEETLSSVITSGTWDITPPTFSNISSLVATPGEENQPTATITWNTNELATAKLFWRRSSIDPWTQVLEDTTADSLTHSGSIENLIPNSIYEYFVSGADGSGNMGTSITKSFEIGNTRPGFPVFSSVVINEFLPNPIGPDNAIRPNGEWIELYNKSNTTKYLMGWQLRNSDGDRLNLTSSNTSALSIAPYGFVVVYRNGNSNFSLRNNAIGDILSLHDNHGWLLDFHTYSAFLGDDVLENKSFARFPDGSATWFDPIPTPGNPNILEPELALSTSADRHFVSFSVKNVEPYTHISYELIYKTDGSNQGFMGSDSLSGQMEYVKEKIPLGSCSSGGTCVYHPGIKNLVLKVTLRDTNGSEIILERTLN